MLVRLTCYAAGMLIGALIAIGYAQHGAWQDAYRSADGTRCCGPADCKAVPVSIIAHDGVTVEALVFGIRVIVPAASVHRSEDAQSWWCMRDGGRPPSRENLRCLF